jgi:hypothetical protein
MAVRKAAGLGTNPGAAIQSPSGLSAAAAPPAAAQSRERPLGLSMLAAACAAIAVVLLLLAGSWLGASDIIPGTRLAVLARFAAVVLGLVAILGVASRRGGHDSRDRSHRSERGARHARSPSPLPAAGDRDALVPADRADPEDAALRTGAKPGLTEGAGSALRPAELVRRRTVVWSPKRH